ncbi:MAG: hypothetical protein R3F43_06970 [bacterium]
MHAPAGRRALLVGVQHPLDPALPRRPGTCAALRRLARALAAGGYTVRALLDDAAQDADRPLFANLLDGLRWLGEVDAGLAVLSASIIDGRVFPRDGRVDHPERTTLALAEVAGGAPGAGRGPRATGGGRPGGDGGPRRPAGRGGGPTAFLRALGASSSRAPSPCPGRRGGRGSRRPCPRCRRPAGAICRPSSSTRRGSSAFCAACGAPFTARAATFCPSCGAPSSRASSWTMAATAS